MVKKKVTKKKIKKVDNPAGKAFVQSSSNNTIITLTDASGNVVSWSSSGSMGFKGSRKSTPYAAGSAATAAAEKALERGLKTIDVYVKGIGSGRESAVRSLKTAGLNVASIADVTPVPHNGCRPKKPRRI